jgi:hypothetical protein
MKHHLVWTNVATAIVSFALGWALTHKSSPSQDHSVTGTQSVNSSSSNSSSNQDDASEETTVRTRVAKRDEKKKTSEPRISLPLATVTEMIREKSKGNFEFRHLQKEMENSLTLLGASEREKNDVFELLNKTESEIEAEEKKLLKVVQTNSSEIHLDNRAMETFSKTIAPKIQEGIRASLPADLADVLISSTQWDKLYPTGEEHLSIFTITRKSSGRISAVFSPPSRSTSMAMEVDSKFKDDGTPVPADEAFQGEHWKHYLKGLTLLPKDEE